MVTGVTGFIGSNIMRYLDSRGYTVFGCGRKKMQYDYCKYISCDLTTDIPDTKADAVIHAAGICPAKDVDFNSYFENNIVSAGNIVKYAKQHDVKRIIYIGTLASYGKVDGVLKEDSPHIDPDAYGLTKYVAEQLIINSGIPYYILNVPTVVGKGSKNNWVMRAAQAMYNNDDVIYYNGQKIFNNILEVQDLCDFIGMLVEKGKWESDTYLLGSSEMTTVEDILLFIKKKFSSNSQLIDSGEKENVFCLDIGKAISNGFFSKPIKDTLEIVCKEIVGKEGRR